jgi:hypothetical protein
VEHRPGMTRALTGVHCAHVRAGRRAQHAGGNRASRSAGAPFMEQALHLRPQLMPRHARHHRVVEALVPAILQLQHNVKAAERGVHRLEALHVDVQVQAAERVQQERPQGVACVTAAPLCLVRGEAVQSTNHSLQCLLGAHAGTHADRVTGMPVAWHAQLFGDAFTTALLLLHGSGRSRACLCPAWPGRHPLADAAHTLRDAGSRPAAAARDALLAALPRRRAFVHDARVCAEGGQEPGIALLEQRLGCGIVPETVLPARVPARARVAPAPVETPQAAALALLPLLLPLQRAQAVQEHLRMRARPRSVRHQQWRSGRHSPPRTPGHGRPVARPACASGQPLGAPTPPTPAHACSVCRRTMHGMHTLHSRCHPSVRTPNPRCKHV